MGDNGHQGPLAGVKVLEFSEIIAAPFGGMLLSDMGADVIKVEAPEGDLMRSRPVHTILLGAEIPICEHVTGLARVPDSGFRFSAAPPKVRGMGSFPVRAYAVLD